MHARTPGSPQSLQPLQPFQHACMLARPAAVPPRWQSPSPATRRPCVDLSFDGLNNYYHFILRILLRVRASPRRRTRRIRCEGVLFHPGALNPRHGASARAQPVRPFREAFVCMSVCLYVGVSVCRCVRMSVCFEAPVGSVCV